MLPLIFEHKFARFGEAWLSADLSEAMRETRRLLTYGAHLYPEYGARDLVDRLASAARARGVTIDVNRHLVELRREVDDRGALVIARFAAGPDIRVREVVTGESSRIDLITAGSRTIRPQWVKTSKTHLLIRFDDGICRPITYVEFRRHRLLRRVGLASRPLTASPVWAVEIPTSALASVTRPKLITDVVTALAEVGLLAEPATPIAHEFTTYQGSRLPDSERAIQQQAMEQLTVLRSWICFGDSLVAFLR